MKTWLRRAGPAAVVALVLAAIGWAFWPRPAEADLAAVARGPLRVTVDEEGKTRIRERYVVSAPLAGSLLRTPLKAGSPVAAGRTVVAVLEPGDPAFLNAREKAETEARVKATGAAIQQSEARVVAARQEHELAAGNLARARHGHAAGATSTEELQWAVVRELVRAEELRAAQFAARVAAFERDLAAAALIRSEPKSALPAEDRRLEVRSPVDGKVLRVFQESAAVVAPGTKLLELGDPGDLELVVEVLSTDAVKIVPGNRVVVERWGGGRPLAARVRLVEPAAFLKVSALGVEEQRVNVVADFTDPPEVRRALGDAYRVEAKVVVWEAADVMKVPAGALFRGPDGGWAVFAVRGGRAVRTAVELGHNNGVEAEVHSGLTAGDVVVLHPSDQIRDGGRVTGR
jgi:HlyD family secretion protein